MILLDVNVALAAYREDHPHHLRVRPWLDGMLAEGSSFTLPDIVCAAFVRICTHRRIFAPPASLAEAFAFVRAVRAQPGHLALDPPAGHLELFEQLCHDTDTSGDLVPDAYLAALAMTLGATLASLDRDFARFPDLRWIRPGESAA